MPIFSYQGRDPQGKLVVGERSVQSADLLSEQLFSEGITPTLITVKTSKAEKKSVMGDIKKLSKTKKVSKSDLAMFVRQMFTLTKSGVSISVAIKHLAQTSRSASFAAMLTGVAESVEAGQNLAAAMERYPEVFTPLIVSMVRIGQDTGQLDKIFYNLTEYLELDESTSKRIKSATRYPTFVITAIVAGIVIINIFVIPVFAGVYSKAGIKLPFITVLLIGMSNFILTHWISILLLLFLMGFGLQRYLKTAEGRYRWDRFQLKIPVFGSLIQRMILLRFAETFSIIANSGIPINDGLVLVSQAITNAYARREVDQMRDSIQRGSSILQAASSCKLFTNLELQMLAISEQTGELGPMLKEIARYYQREVDYDLKHLIDLIEPLLLILVACMVLLLALAVYMPIWNMVKLVKPH